MVEAVLAELGEAGYEPAGEGEHWLTGGTALDSVILTSESDGDRVTLLQPEELFGPDSIPPTSSTRSTTRIWTSPT